MTARSPKKILLEIPRHLKDKRFDKALFLLLQLKYPENKALSRGFSATLIKNGQALLNGEVAQLHTQVSFQDTVTFTEDVFSTEQKAQAPRKAQAMKVIYEDERLLVINKPAGIKVHGETAREGDTVVAWIQETRPELLAVGGDLLRPGIVHRLDRETSGVLVIAKDEETFQELKQAFQKRKVKKTYFALVYGHLPLLEGKIDTPLMRLSGELKRKAVNIEGDFTKLPGNLRSALTYYAVMARYHNFDLVRVMPQTGRTHQIRVHLSSLGYPIVGDKLYAFKPARRGELFFPERQMLHAAMLSVELFGEQYSFQAPLPADFQKVLRDIDETRESSYDDEALKGIF